MERNCRIIELTADVPWNPTEANIAGVQILRGRTLEDTTYKTICAIGNIPRCNDACKCNSNLSVYDTNHMIRHMISSVKVSTAHRDDLSIAYVGARDRHSRVTPETVAKTFRCGLEAAQRTLKTTTQPAFDTLSTRCTAGIVLTISTCIESDSRTCSIWTLSSPKSNHSAGIHVRS
jgi:hypothetical protein